MKKKKEYQYPWRNNNTFQVLVDGTEYFSSMLNEIKNAKSSILLEEYLFESGKTADLFITALCKAKNRGVNVFVLLDEYGTKGLSDADKKTLISSGIELLLYNPVSFFHIGKSLKRDHKKMLAVDNQTAFIGGAGITDEFTQDIRHDYWHDVMLKIDGEIVLDLVDAFNDIWKTEKESLQIFHQPLEAPPKEIKNKARVLISSSSEKNEIIRSVINRIRASKRRVWLTSPYFISSWKVRRALRFAAKKGVDVRLIFPGPYSDHKWITSGIQRYYQRLLKANVAVYEFQPRFTHAKIIVCDDWYTIGSSNLDLWNQYLNIDANIEIYDPLSHKQIIKLFNDNFSRSTLIILKKWNARSFIQHVREKISGFIISVLVLISRKFKR
ncbi:MAG: phosphatidylserine/phosphatidylglycerophosphate/cardiolipin synthase family protein [Gammaproteobacteria bacterium]|nr:phosphatidylserine/phosphatidylglycerophosphate/cardiolipin synthase family protein [Gammaproteobacteria bacterium]MCW8988515.1 phosphatidylserine/phosphatidylglycerophosphate/cardiolipin synthase family protein [Gammaproteobacteria bacterium]